MFDNVYHKVSRSSAVWMAKKTEINNEFNYRFLFFKRHGGTLFGNNWAGPGGMLEPQDDYDVWKTNFPHFYEKYQDYVDLNLRICCLRELYEEWSILPAYRDSKFCIITEEELNSSAYTTKEFALFWKEKNIFPAIDKLYAFLRISPPLDVKFKRIDSQFYLYFVENDEDQLIKLNKDELTDQVDYSRSQ